MRIVWKDTAKKVQPVKYRNYIVSGYDTGGWVTDIPGDDNIYKSHYCAMNAIDEYLGGYGNKGKMNSKRFKCGIEVVGKKDNESA